MTTARPRFPLLFVLGAPHSGTTLIGRMLAMHPAAVYVGELLRLGDTLTTPDRRCWCGATVRECLFWSRCISSLPAAVAAGDRPWSIALIEQLRAALGADLLIDSSKTRAYRLRRRWGDPPVGYLVMVRDPRGALRSSLRAGMGLRRLLRRHRKWILRYAAFARKNPSRCQAVFYEDLMASTEAELRRVCTFLGLPFLPEMLTPNAKTQHPIAASRSSYLKESQRVAKDERWRQELTPEQIAQITAYLGTVPWYRHRYFS